jgi:dienelactone hydrolase
MTMERTELNFDSSGLRCAGLWYVPEKAGRHPVIVMAHGMGATRELGLDRFARRFCLAGFCVLAFDYRHYGASDGEPRELLSIARQREDYRAAVDFVRTRSEVDPSRIALWGSSFSGGHVIALAAEELNLKAVIAQVPFTSGRAAALGVSLRQALRINARALRDLFAQALGRAPVYVPWLRSSARAPTSSGNNRM